MKNEEQDRRKLHFNDAAVSFLPIIFASAGQGRPENGGFWANAGHCGHCESAQIHNGAKKLQFLGNYFYFFLALSSSLLYYARNGL